MTGATVPTISIGELQAQLVQLGYAIPAKEQKAVELGTGTRAALEGFQAANVLPQTGDPDAATSVALAAVVAGHTYAVTGTVQSPALPGVGDATVRLVDKNVGGDQVLSTTRSGIGGGYSFSTVISPEYLTRHSKSQPDLQVQVLAGESVLASSEVRYSAPQAISLDVLVPATAEGLPSEYETLTASLATAYPGSLGDLQEDGTRQDITYLANKTGWDARMVALAALADQFSQIATPAPAGKAATGRKKATAKKQSAATQAASVTVRPELYYALFRAGLPADTETLFQVSPVTVQAIWQQAIAQGVIPQALSKEVPAAGEAFHALSAAKVLTAKPLVGVSTLAEMLQTTLPEAAQQEQFARLYTQYADDPEALWPAVEKAVGAGPAAQLQSLGKLYYLTVNNQPLVEALVKGTSENGAATIGSPLELVARGYYEASAWTSLIAAASIPAQIPGTDASEQASNYAELMAAQIRLSYPTAVLADQVSRGMMPITDTDAVASEVVDFLGSQQGEFEIGVEPIEAFIARTGAAAPSEAAVAQVKRLQRAYQLTPDDTTLAVLLNHNLDSAYAITRYDPTAFARTFAAQLGGEEKASAIHARARQIYMSVTSIAVEYLKERVTANHVTAGPVHVGGSPVDKPPASVVAYPTLESLFGDLDYCACSECSSILSPAAYFVDLLHFIDQPGASAGFENPQEVLFARRPDLQYLNLTCANTDTALPYIDIVNETLEYFVANDLSIEGYEGHNTSDEITSAELIASPQYVNDDAYAVLQGTYFPPPLPFNRSLTLLRLQLQGMGIELPAAMRALRANDSPTNSQTPTSYGWRDILIEQLGISRDEYRLFTGPLELGQLYGLPAGLPAAEQLETLRKTSLQGFSRRLGVSYDALVAIVQTQFINPDASLIPLLERLNCSFAKLEQLNSDTEASAAASTLPAGLDATLYGASTADDYETIVAWVKANYARIADTITITDTSGNAEDCSGADLYLRRSDPSSPPLSATDFRKLILFIRLWRKLTPLLVEGEEEAGIQDTDRILAALYPPAYQPLPAKSDAANAGLLEQGFEQLLPRLGFLVQVMDELSLSGEPSLQQLLACWAPIGTKGTGSLYAEIFLTPTLLQEDPGAATATVSATVSAGDVLATSFNSAPGAQPQVSCEVEPGQSASTVATKIAALINASAAIDPATQAGGPVSVGERYHATSDGRVVTIKAGFTLECSLSSAGGTYAPTPVPADSLLASVSGTVTATDVLTTTIDGIAITYPVPAGATLESIAAGIATAINAAGAPAIDPLSGKPINQAFNASSDGATVTVTQVGGGGFTLECSSPAPATELYVSQSPICQMASVGGTLSAGDVLTTEIDTVEISHPVLAGETPEAAAAAIATAINATTTADPYSGLPINDLVAASSFGATVLVLAVDAGAPFSLACSLTPPGLGSADASAFTAIEPTPAHWTATVSGAVKEGDTLETTINGVTIPYAAVAIDTDATALASSVAAAINATTELEAASGLALNAVVHAVSAAGVITITAVDPATPIALACKASGAEGYLADGPVCASAVATVSGTVPVGAMLTTTINGIPVLYAVQSSLTAQKVAEGVAQSINETETADPLTSTPLNKLLKAVASQGAQGEGLVTVTAELQTTSFTIEASITASGYTAGRRPAPFAGDGSGEFLTDPSQTLFGHAPTLCAACNITGAEFQLIAAHCDYGPNEPLTLESVSVVYRYGWLARTLALSVEELVLLIESTGLEPFESIDPGTTPAPVEPPVIRLARLLSAMNAAGLSVDQALYLMWNQDVSGNSAPTADDVSALAVALRAAFAAVDAAFTFQDDPSGSIAEGLMTLVYGATATDFFFGLLNSTFATSVAYAAPTGVSSVAPTVVEAAGGRLSYDNLAKQLMFDGVLDSVTQAAILAAITVATTAANTTSPGLATFTPASMQNIYAGTALVIDTGAVQETVVVTATTATTFTASTLQPHSGTIAIANDPSLVQAIASLAAANQKAVGPFFASYPELQPLYAEYAGSSEPPQERRTALLESFLPTLVGERKQQQALVSVTAAAGTDQSFASALLEDASILHADTDQSAPAVSDFTAIAQAGLAACFYLTNDLDDPNATPDLRAAAAPTLSYSQTATVGDAIAPGAALETKIDDVTVAYVVGGFTLACSVSGTTEILTPASLSSVSQKVTVEVPAAVTQGDVLTVTLDGVPVPYTVLGGDTATTIAANMAAAINATTVEDPVVGAPLNEVLLASSAGDVVNVTVLPDGASVRPACLARGVAAAINATATPVGGVPLSQVVAASSEGATVTFTRANLESGGYLSLECSISGAVSPLYGRGTQLPPPTSGSEIAAVWSGYIVAPQSGVYDVSIAADEGASVRLEIDGEQVLGTPAGGLWSNDTEISLEAGVLTPVKLSAESLATMLSVSWRSHGLGWQAIPGECLYSLDLIECIRNTYARFLKAASLAGALSLSAAEIASLGTQGSYAVNTTSASSTKAGAATFTPASMANIKTGSELVIDGPASIRDPLTGIDTPGSQETITVTATAETTFTASTTKSHGGSASRYPIVDAARPELGEGWINSLAGDPVQTEPAAHELTPVLTALLDFARIKHALSPNDGRLLAVLQEPAAKLPNGQSALLSLTGWSLESLQALLTQFSPGEGLSSLGGVESFRRVYDAFALVTASRLSASALICAITNAPAPDTLLTLQSALRSQYAPADWLTVVTPINNAARIAQRDALVAYIVQQEGDLHAVPGGPPGTPAPVSPAIGTPNDLYAYLMIDPENEPAVLTSRILLATLTVQVFVDRATSNMELQVAPADINRSLWTTLKTYRLWQANREVFLHPENWLFPELRDDQSPFFQTTMSTLLQGDIDEEAATSAYLQYLTNLEEVAKLEACGLFYEPPTYDSDETAIVVSRTAGAHRKYYFRELSSGAWEPWAEVQIDCEDLPLTPIVWEGRLFLFWLKAIKGPAPAQELEATAVTKLEKKAVSKFELSDLQTLRNATQASQTYVSMGGVLCWSEYYNGKWQPTKTSDVHLPTELGEFELSGPGSFEQMRSVLTIAPGWLVPTPLAPDALIVAVVNQQTGTTLGGFMFHNSHSLPVRLDDLKVGRPPKHVSVTYLLNRDGPEPDRRLGPIEPYTGAFEPATFAVSYQERLHTKPHIIDVLRYQWMPRFVQAQPGLPDAWSTPFIYENRRHLFYVRSSVNSPPLFRFTGFGVPAEAVLASAKTIAPLVLSSSVAARREVEAVDPGSIALGLTNTNVVAALDETEAVTYDGQEISVTGSVPGSAGDDRAQGE
jgi:hypothetical protein